jgi:ribose-phosphate pyrophosphokinase
MKPLLIPMPGHDELARRLAVLMSADDGEIVVRRFPDGESYVRIESNVCEREVVVLAALDRPDDKIVPLLLALRTLRDLGAKRVVLVAPYLPYMRQDHRFHPGEAVSSRIVAAMLDAAVDALVTVDPHLHRHHDLGEIYTKPATAVSAAGPIAAWIRAHAPRSVLIGPDAESAQWAEAVASEADVPWTALAKRRLGDRRVEITAPDLSPWLDRTPILLDDIASTGKTLVAAATKVRGLRVRPPVCLVVHPIFSAGAEEALMHAGIAYVASCNTIPHPTNQIDIAAVLSEGIRPHLEG